MRAHVDGLREEAFTLIELLVVVLVLGILAAIAIPSFTGQRGKAQDARAKNNIASAQRAMETYFIEHKTYATANMNAAPDPDSLLTIDRTLIDSPTPTIRRQTASSYTLRVVSTSSTPVTFRLRRQTSGQMRRWCTPASTGGCDAAGTW